MPRRKSPPTRREQLHLLFESRLGRVLVRVTAAALLFLLAGIVMRQARAYTYRLEDFRVHRDRVALVELPTWADAHMQWALQPSQFPALSVSIYDPEAERMLRTHAERHPFVREVEGVRILYPNRAEVKARLRVPVALVEVWQDAPGRRQHRVTRLLSDDGCLLPTGPYKTYLARRPYELPLLRGITEPPPRRAGETWEDGSGRVAEGIAAARLAERIHRDSRGLFEVVRVDVSRFPASLRDRDAGEVRLVISAPRSGARVQHTVEWGRTERSADDVIREDDYRTKYERLERYLTGPKPPGFLDVRFKPIGQRRTPR